MVWDFPGGSEVKASACSAGDLGLIPGSGRSSGEGTGNPLQYPCLENPMDGEAWWVAVHGVTKSRIQLSNFTFTFTLWFSFPTFEPICCPVSVLTIAFDVHTDFSVDR